MNAEEAEGLSEGDNQVLNELFARWRAAQGELLGTKRLSLSVDPEPEHGSDFG